MHAKALAVGVLILAAGISGMSQGNVYFNNHIYQVISAPVYLGYGSFAGNGPEGYPPGTVNWTGFNLVSGSGFSAALFSAPGPNAPESTLAQAEPVTVFRTGSAAGYVVPVVVTLPNVAKDASIATLQMRVWENKNGLYTNWAAAKQAWAAGLLRAGTSATFNLNAIGGDLNTPPNLTGLRSFNVIDMSMYPPPLILAQPQSVVAVAHQTVTFYVGAQSQAPCCPQLDYKWFCNGRELSVSNSATLVLTNVQTSDEGNYSALVWSAASGSVVGSTASASAILRVLARAPELKTGVGYGGSAPDGFHFTLVSDPATKYSLQRSTDLLAWQEFLVVTNESGQLPLIDTWAQTNARCFYRALARLP